MAITYFNWNELLHLSRKDYAAIICLTYAQTMVYNELSASGMRKRLKLDQLPTFLFQSKVFTQYKHTLKCNYTTNEPQSYFKNPDFLFTNTLLKHRVMYLRALSMRRISDKNDKIPLKYYPSIEGNPFVKINNGFIEFIYESSVPRKNTARTNVQN